MRILNLRLKNLNSLAGEWHVDFTHPEYEGNRLFAIIGPTGAGKSTLLDAICLALYGKTPRLGKVTQGTNELMSRHTGECFAEVTFETTQGKYRCFWGQNRARKKAGEKLQPPQREIIDVLEDKVLETQISLVDAKIEEITGMDFQRFTRSMMLAQGGFDAFLKAQASERAPILEQITGTEIYTDISIKVFDRTKVEIQNLEKLQIEFAAINPLPEEDEHRLTHEYSQRLEEVTALNQKLQRLNDQKAWRIEIDKCIQALKALENDWSIFIQDENAAQPDLNRLEQSLKALNFEGDFRDLNNLRKQQELDKEKLAKDFASKMTLEKALIEQSTQVEDYQKLHALALEKQKEIAAIIKQVRELDNDKDRENDQLRRINDRIAQVEDEIQNHKKSLDASLKQHKNYVLQLQEIEAYFEANLNDESLLEKFSSITDSLDRLKDKKKLIEQKQNEHRDSVDKLEDAKTNVKLQRKHYEDAKKSIENSQITLKKVTEEHLAISEGRDSVQWNEASIVLSSRKLTSQGLIEVLEKQLKIDSSCECLRQEIHAFTTKLQNSLEKEKSINESIETCEAKIAALERQQELQNRIHSFEDERKRLSDNDPCPLCGSLDHPFANGNIPYFSEVDNQLIDAKSERKGLEKAKIDFKDIPEFETEIRIRQKNLIDQTDLTTQLKTKIQELLLQLGYSASPVPTLSEYAKEHADITFQEKEFAKKHKAYLNKCREKEAAQNAFNSEVQKHSEQAQNLDTFVQLQNNLENLASNLQQACSVLATETLELENSILERVKPYGIFNLEFSGLDDIKHELTHRLNSWKRHLQRKKQLGDEIQNLQLMISIANTHLEQSYKTLQELQSSKTQNDLSIANIVKMRLELFAEKIPDKEEEQLAKSVELASSKLEEFKEKRGHTQHQLATIGNSIQELTSKTLERANLLQSDETQFTKKISDAGFPTLEIYTQALLPHETREKLSLFKASIDKRKSDLLARKKFAIDKHAELNLAPQTEKSLEILIEEIDKISAELDKIKERTSYLKTILAENEKKRETAKAMEAKIVQQGKEAEIWKALCSLIGSGDGKKFRDFAQKMTLEMMIAHANRQLMKMSDRYLLKQSKNTPLELEVIDNYQAGEERSVKNLSGGESFIVSLALALGLSQMASSKVRVDSLFLDEGFGTLDEKALEVALDTLGELQQEGKVIGLISHVTSLKERISTQILVNPISGGRSRIEGPGCSAIARHESI